MPKDSISKTSLKRRLDAKDLIRGIKNIGHQFDLKSSTPLIADLRMNWTFEDKVEKKGASVIDLVLLVLRLLREDI